MSRFRLPVAVLATVTVTMTMSAAAYAATSPTVSTGAATSVTDTSVVLNGTVNPNGSKTTYMFQYGPTTAYGNVTRVTKAGSGTKSVAATATITGLTPGTPYDYRLEAINGSGTAVGAGRSLRTSGNPPPTPTTGAAVNVGTTSATLTGIVNPEGAATVWAFRYGLTTGYGVQTFGGTVPAGATPVPVSETINGLDPGATFHFQLVAFHGSTIAGAGADASFETLPDPAPAPKIGASTTPRTARRKPYDFLTSGHITGPASTPGTLDCIGDAKVSYFLGNRRLRSTLAPIQADCTFAASEVFRKLPGSGPKGRTVALTVTVRFEGNGYLAPVSARKETVTLG